MNSNGGGDEIDLLWRVSFVAWKGRRRKVGLRVGGGRGRFAFEKQTRV